MFSFPRLRKRLPSNSNIVSGGNAGFFRASPVGSPVSGDQMVGLARPADPMAFYHQGDLFTPGTVNFVFELNLELPVVTIWGNAFLRTPNTFKPIPPPPLIAEPRIFHSGIGGLQAGQLDLQGLEY
jgi:hypothetical protein